IVLVADMDVEGYAGWYIHVGNKDDPMIMAPMLDGGAGTYDWKQVSLGFTAPEGATRASLGTVLRGTGTAWFDDVTLECASPPKLTAVAAPPEALDLAEGGADALWYDDDPDDDVRWDYRVALNVMNPSDAALDNALIFADLATLTSRLRRAFNPESVRVADGLRLLRHYAGGEMLLFECAMPPRSARTYYVYLSADERIVRPEVSHYRTFVAGPLNLVRNPDFEHGETLPDGWPGGAEGSRPPGASMDFDRPGPLGRRCVRTHVPHDADRAWIGWRQDVPVEPGKTYLYAAWVKCRDLRGGSVQLYAHYRNADGELCATKKHTSAGPAVSGTTDWTLMSGTFTMPEDIATFQLHLTMNATGTVWHNGVLLAEVAPAAVGRLEARGDEEAEGLAVWPLNALVKVFREDVPPREVGPARISAARNEKEPLQLAVRSAEDVEGVRIEVDPPVNARGQALTDVEVAVVGYVPIDHKTNYYSTDVPEWHRKYPTGPGASDGWAGMWPDPLLPRSTFDLAAHATQPVWITLGIPKDAAAGDYAGKVRLLKEGVALKEVPFTVRVWDLTLPDESHLAAVYDLRLGGRWSLPGQDPRETRERFWRFMAERRVCPDRIHPDPVIRYENGQVVADFTEFDEAAEYYFNELKMPVTYTPWYFYLFGWGHPPGAKFGEEPYEGGYPYEAVDRSRLRPEFKRAYQACLKAYWDHMKEKGWADRCVLYISDEPHFRHPHVREQMKALCEMVHEVDPAIPIYSSTWHHLPEWDGYLDVWGIGHYGVVPPEKMGELREAGDRLWFTTDGHMCTDTPYSAIERLLPHYCFQYGVEAYEFWGISWLTYDPYEFGWHSYIRQSDQPGQSRWVRYPNGDGFLAYPGGPVGHDGP
ncbi:MAG: carbohydrate binding domain-containing protein, partial [Candidatus Brocadiae bacterium]|nr:carbohydrate binding domain-containing protein [Candidatus Brocadiia bacterium]